MHLSKTTRSVRVTSVTSEGFTELPPLRVEFWFMIYDDGTEHLLLPFRVEEGSERAD